MKAKRPEIDPEIAKQVQAYADQHCDGNFTQAINNLILIGITCLQPPKNEAL